MKRNSKKNVPKESASDMSDLNNSDGEDAKMKDADPKDATKSANPESKLHKILVRTVMAFGMVGFYLGMLRGGHFYCILTAVLTQVFRFYIALIITILFLLCK
jgi:hypothetical protein